MTTHPVWRLPICHLDTSFGCSQIFIYPVSLFFITAPPSVSAPHFSIVSSSTTVSLLTEKTKTAITLFTACATLARQFVSAKEEDCCLNFFHHYSWRAGFLWRWNLPITPCTTITGFEIRNTTLYGTSSSGARALTYSPLPAPSLCFTCVSSDE